jgi:hypothetical protein
VTTIRRAVSLLVGGIQCVFGTLALVLAVLIYAVPEVQMRLITNLNEVYLYMFIFSVFGILSIVSGTLLMYREEWGD